MVYTCKVSVAPTPIGPKHATSVLIFNSDIHAVYLCLAVVIPVPLLSKVVYPSIHAVVMNDPNFPSNLDIRPLHLTQQDNTDVWKQQDAIKQYGIAGRIWCVQPECQT